MRVFLARPEACGRSFACFWRIGLGLRCRAPATDKSRQTQQAAAKTIRG